MELSMKVRMKLSMKLSDQPLNKSDNDLKPDQDARESLLSELPDWSISVHEQSEQLQRSFRFSSYADALRFTVDIGDLAVRYGYYPTIITTYGKVTVLWHIARDGQLNENDFILAAKTSQLITV